MLPRWRAYVVIPQRQDRSVVLKDASRQLQIEKVVNWPTCSLFSLGKLGLDLEIYARRAKKPRPQTIALAVADCELYN